MVDYGVLLKENRSSFDGPHGSSESHSNKASSIGDEQGIEAIRFARIIVVPLLPVSIDVKEDAVSHGTGSHIQDQASIQSVETFSLIHVTQGMEYASVRRNRIGQGVVVGLKP